MITAAGHREREARDPRLAKRTGAHLVWLRQELTGSERDLDGAVKAASPAWRADEQLLTSVPGVGSTTARTLLAEPAELGTLDRRKIATLVDVAPLNRDSGIMRGRRTVQGGRGSVRAALYMAALVAPGAMPPSVHSTSASAPAGRPAKLVLTACMRKLLTILNAILHSRSPAKPLDGQDNRFSPLKRLPPSFLHPRCAPAPAPCSRVPAKPLFPVQPHHSRDPGKQRATRRCFAAKR